MAVLQQLLLPFVLLAAAWVIYFGVRNYRALSRNIARLDQALDAASDDLSAVHDAEGLEREFERVSRQIGAQPILGPFWLEFSRNLVRSEHIVGIRSPRPASAFFNEDILERSEIDIRRFDAVPNQLIGYGLMFTFFGLVLTIAIASAGLGGDAAQLQTALEWLLVAAGSKFVTSIAAIFASLQFTWRKNQLLQITDQKLERFRALVDDLVPPISPEELAVESRGQLELQSKLLTQREAELASAIALQLDQTLRANLPRVLEPLLGEVRAITSNIHNINESTLDAMVERFSQRMGTSVQEHSRAIVGMLDQISVTVGEMPEKFAASAERFGQVFDTLTGRIDETLQGSARGLEILLDRTGTNVAARCAELEGVADRLAATLTRAEEASEQAVARNERVAADAKQALEALQTGARQIVDATEPLKPLAELASRLEPLTAQLVEVSAGMGNFVGDSKNAIAQSVAAVESLSQSASTFSTGVSELEASLGSVFRQLAEGVDNFRGKVDAAVGGVDYNLGVAVDRLSDVVDQLSRAGSAHPDAPMPAAATFNASVVRTAGRRHRKSPPDAAAELPE